MAGEELDRILNGLSKDEYAKEMGLNYTLKYESIDPLDEYQMDRTGRLNTLYGHPGNWPAVKLRELAHAAVGVETLSGGDGLAEMEEESARMRDDDYWDMPVWAAPFLTAASRANLESIVERDEKMPRGGFARRMIERIKPVPKLRIMPGCIAEHTNYRGVDPITGWDDVCYVYDIELREGEWMDVTLDPSRAKSLLEAIDDLEARGIKFDRIAPIAPSALLMLSELAERGLFEHLADLEPYVPYVDPRSEGGWVYLGKSDGRDCGPELENSFDISSTLYYLPESDRFFCEDKRGRFSDFAHTRGRLSQLTREGAYNTITNYAAGRDEKFATAATPAIIGTYDHYSLSSSDEALKVIAELTSEFEPESVVKMASDGVQDLWHLDNIDEYILAEKADTLKEAHGIEGVTQSEAEEFKRNIAATLIPGKEFELDGVDIDQDARQSLDDIVSSKSMEAGCATLDKSPTERGASRRDNAPSADIAI